MMTTSVLRKTAGARRRSLLGAPAEKAPQGVDKMKRKIVNENHVEAEAEVAIAIVIVIVIVIVSGTKDEVEVAIVIVTAPEDKVRNAEVTNEDRMKARIVIEKRGEVGVGARTDEVETTTEKEEVVVGIETERRDEVLIEKNRGEKAVRKRKEAEKGRAADETFLTC